MSSRIEKFTELMQSYAFHHRIADIPGGVAVKTSHYPNGGTIIAGSLLFRAENGLYRAATSINVLESTSDDALIYTVPKDHLFSVGDRIYKSKAAFSTITEVDQSNDFKDFIKVDTTLGIKRQGDVLTQFIEGDPVAVVGENVKFRHGDNVLVTAWVIALMNKFFVPEPPNKPELVFYF